MLPGTFMNIPAGQSDMESRGTVDCIGTYGQADGFPQKKRTPQRGRPFRSGFFAAVARIVPPTPAAGCRHMPGSIDAVARLVRSRAAMTVGEGHCCQTGAFALVDAINHDRSPFYSAVAL